MGQDFGLQTDLFTLNREIRLISWIDQNPWGQRPNGQQLLIILLARVANERFPDYRQLFSRFFFVAEPAPVDPPQSGLCCPGQNQCYFVRFSQELCPACPEFKDSYTSSTNCHAPGYACKDSVLNSALIQTGYWVSAVLAASPLYARKGSAFQGWTNLRNCGYAAAGA